MALLILFCMSFFSHWHGKQELSTLAQANIASSKYSLFPYMWVIETKNDYLIMKDQWDDVYKVYWAQESSVTPGVLLSFKGNLIGETIHDVHGIINHQGYMLKMYISLTALIVLCGFFLRWFGIDNKGLYLREKK